MKLCHCEVCEVGEQIVNILGGNAYNDWGFDGVEMYDKIASGEAGFWIKVRERLHYVSIFAMLRYFKGK